MNEAQYAAEAESGKKQRHVLDNFRGKTWPKKSVLGDNRPGENGGLHFQSMASTLQVGRWEESEVAQVISTQNLPHWSKRESKTWPPSIEVCSADLDKCGQVIGFS